MVFASPFDCNQAFNFSRANRTWIGQTTTEFSTDRTLSPRRCRHTASLAGPCYLLAQPAPLYKRSALAGVYLQRSKLSAIPLRHNPLR